MAGNYTTTARNALRALLGTSKGSDIDEGFLNLANDVDSKMLSWWQGTLAERPAAGQPNRFYKATNIGVIFHDTGTIWEPVMPNLAVRGATTGITAASGDLIECTGGTTFIVTSPSPTANAIFGVSNAMNEPVPITVKAASGLIYGDFVKGVSSVVLTTQQHITLQADGTNWMIIAGEPKREQSYEAGVSRTVATLYKPSAIRPVEVVVRVQGGEAISSWVINVGGVLVHSGGGAQTLSYTFTCVPGVEWEVQKVTGTISAVFSSYRPC